MDHVLEYCKLLFLILEEEKALLGGESDNLLS